MKMEGRYWISNCLFCADLWLFFTGVLLNYNFQHTGKRKKPQHRKLRGKQQKKLQLQPESLTTVPSEASKVSRDVTSQPTRPISDWQKHSAGISQCVILVMEWRQI